MKIRIFHTLVLVLLFSSAFTQNLKRVEDFGENKGNLKMYTYIPAHLDHSNPVPLVVVMHGCTQSADMIAKETGWNKLADSLNFMVIYPEQRQINNATKCFNFFIGFKAKKDQGEVASVRRMIDYMLLNYSIDKSRLFITGMSAGAAMSNALLNAYPELFKAGALLAGPSNLFDPNKNKTQPNVFILQGDRDLIVNPKNAQRITNQWIKKHRLNKSDKEIIPNYNNNPQLTLTKYYSANKELKLMVLIGKDITHKVLIDPGDDLTQGGELDFHTVDIDFHSTYCIAEFFELVQ